MRYLVLISLLAWLTINIQCHPYYDSAPVERRNEASLIDPIFTTKIRLENGTDVSTSFSTKVYWQPDTPISSNSSLHSRQVYRVRRIDSCESPTAQFIQSRCQRSRGIESSLQQYIVYCREFPHPHHRPANGVNEPIELTEEGTCEPNELCVDDPIDVIATCVNRNDYMNANQYNDNNSDDSVNQESQGSHNVNGNLKGSQYNNHDPTSNGGTDDLSRLAAGFFVERALGNRKASVIVSATDGITPLGLQNLEVDFGTDSGRRIETQQKCKHCFGLRTHKAAADTDSLATKATLLATTAVTGIVWIAVFAG